MMRSELREHVFKMLFQIEFNDASEMPEQKIRTISVQNTKRSQPASRRSMNSLIRRRKGGRQPG